MKNRLFAFILCLSFVSAAFPAYSNADTYVWLGNYDKQYHYIKNCPDLSKDRHNGLENKEALEEYAKKLGYKPCPKCMPFSEAAKIGFTQTVGNNRYVVTSASTVRYKGPVSKKIKSVTIPKTVKIKKKTYKVTAIGRKAFNGCGKLKIIRICIPKLTKAKVGKAAFRGICRKATFYVPRGKAKAYRKIFLKRGAKKTMKFKWNQ